MVLSVLLTVMTLLCVATVAADADDGNSAYVRKNITRYVCVAFPMTDLCPGLNITVLEDSLDTYVTTLRSLNNSLRNSGAKESCIDAVIKQQCLGTPHCVGDGQGQTLDSDAALAQCRRARSQCETSSINNDFVDCDSKEEQYKNLPNEKESCEIIQDKSGFCPDVKYKRYIQGSNDYSKLFKQFKSGIEPLKENATEECYKKVKALACSNPGACSDDGKQLLALFNQKDCNNTVDCLRESDRGFLKDHLCSPAPDADNSNVQKVPYPTGYQTPGKSSSLKNTSFQVVIAVFSTYIGIFFI